MSFQTGNFIFCLVLTLLTHSHGVQFLLDTNPDGVVCGHLQCWADKIFTDNNIQTVVSLTVYDDKQSNMPVKLASLSVFDTHLYVNEIESRIVNVTGNISSYHAELTLSLREIRYCLNGSFMCELDFVNLNGQPLVIRETTSPGNSGNCLVFSEFAKMAIQIKTHSDEVEKEILELEKENTELRQENVALKTEVSRLQEIVNSSLNKPQVGCFKGMPHTDSREIFLLWNKVAAVCDTETDGGGWIIIQRRTKGDVDFYRNWADYKNGFGTTETDFWVGNDVIHNLTSEGYTELRVDMEYNGTQYFAQYSDFDVADETSLYRLSVSGYSGTAGDSLTYHDGKNFSTFDNDNDVYSDRNCAFSFHGAWWYDSCYTSSLNGMWGAGNDTGLVWLGVDEWSGFVSASEMKVRHP